MVTSGKAKKRSWLTEVTKPKAQALEGSYREPIVAHLTYGDSIVRLAGRRRLPTPAALGNASLSAMSGSSGLSYVLEIFV
jgi:hypothetical protein